MGRHDTSPWPTKESAAFCLIDAGLSDYDVVYSTQLQLVEKRKKSQVSYDYLIFVEHPNVYTYGRKSKEKAEEVSGLKNTFFVERGGEVTYHSPGQLVCYPILMLREGERDLHLYLRKLEAVIIDVLKEFNIEGERREGLTGVWIGGQRRKIASLGVAVSSWVTYHGCALNVQNDLSGFSRIRPCGLDSEVMTSMAVELGGSIPAMQEVKDAFLRHFSMHFERFLMI